jgi:hypothetical protein
MANFILSIVKEKWIKNMLVTERKPKKRAKFRISFVVLFFLASFIICFLTYMRNENDFVFPGSGEASGGNSSGQSAVLAGDSEETPGRASADGENTGGGGIVTESEAKDVSYLSNAFFVGANELSSLSGFAWVRPDRVLSDNSIKSSNIDSLVVRYGGTNQTPEEAVISVKPDALYILLRPEAELDTVHLKAFTDAVAENLEDTEIYIISAFPPTEDSAVTTAETDTFNSALLDFCEENDIKYLDINLSLTDNAGRLKKDYISGNGISGTGAQFLAEFILSHT